MEIAQCVTEFVWELRGREGARSNRLEEVCQREELAARSLVRIDYADDFSQMAFHVFYWES